MKLCNVILCLALVTYGHASSFDNLHKDVLATAMISRGTNSQLILSPQDLGRCERVCKHWRTTIIEKNIWKIFSNSHGQHLHYDIVPANFYLIASRFAESASALEKIEHMEFTSKEAKQEQLISIFWHEHDRLNALLLTDLTHPKILYKTQTRMGITPKEKILSSIKSFWERYNDFMMNFDESYELHVFESIALFIFEKEKTLQDHLPFEENNHVTGFARLAIYFMISMEYLSDSQPIRSYLNGLSENEHYAHTLEVLIKFHSQVAQKKLNKLNKKLARLPGN